MGPDCLYPVRVISIWSENIADRMLSCESDIADWGSGDSEIKRFCLARHEGTVNVTFFDFSLRKIGVKELWTLKWHRKFNTAGPWTKAGGIRPEDWPEWMRNFKAYKTLPNFFVVEYPQGVDWPVYCW